MTEHTVVLRQNTAAVEKLTLAVEAQKIAALAPSPIKQKIIDACISWGVPVSAFAILWLIVNSGAVAGLTKGHP